MPSPTPRWIGVYNICMEGSPRKETTPDSQKEQELSFNQKLSLAETLFDAVTKRNTFIQAQGGFDTFAEAGQYAGNMRSAYDDMESAVSHARKELDEKISDKAGFIKQLRDAGDNSIADMIREMFEIAEGSVFSRIFKK